MKWKYEIGFGILATAISFATSGGREVPFSMQSFHALKISGQRRCCMVASLKTLLPKISGMFKLWDMAIFPLLQITKIYHYNFYYFMRKHWKLQGKMCIIFI